MVSCIGTTSEVMLKLVRNWAWNVKRTLLTIHNKSHIGKVMAHCTVGYCFDSNVEDVGDGYLIGVHRCANFKVPYAM